MDGIFLCYCISLRACPCDDEEVNALSTSVKTLTRWVYMYMLR
jgi:hypothetical protein